MKDTFVLTDMSIKLYKCFKYEKNSSKIEASDDVVISDLPFFFFFSLRFGSWKSVASFHRAFKKKIYIYNPWKWKTCALIITAMV